MTEQEVIKSLKHIKFPLNCVCQANCAITFEFTHVEQWALANAITFYINENDEVEGPDLTGDWTDHETEAERNT